MDRQIEVYKTPAGVEQMRYVPTAFEKRMRRIFKDSDDEIEEIVRALADEGEIDEDTDRDEFVDRVVSRSDGAVTADDVTEWMRARSERFGKADLSELGDLVSEASGQDRAAALRCLMHTTRGQALAVAHKRKDDPDMGAQKFQTFCKNVTANGTSLSEHGLCALATVAAMQLYPGMSRDQAFAKVYGDPTTSEQARDFWRAIAVAKNTVEVGGSADVDGDTARRRRRRLADDDDGDDGDALEKLQVIAKRQRRDGETIEQSFARAFTDPANRTLAAAERRQNGAPR